MSFAEKIKEQEEVAKKQGISSSGGDWFKIKEGMNAFRVLTEPELMFEKYNVGICYTDCGYEGSPKFLCYVLDRADNKIKLAKLPYGIGTEIAGWEEDEELSFDGFPMSYDVRLQAENAGTKEVDYKTNASRKIEEVPSDILEELKKKKTVAEIIQSMKDKQIEKHKADGTWDKRQAELKEMKDSLSEARKKGAEEGPDEPVVPYPEEDINPEDIPF